MKLNALHPGWSRLAFLGPFRPPRSTTTIRVVVCVVPIFAEAWMRVCECVSTYMRTQAPQVCQGIPRGYAHASARECGSTPTWAGVLHVARRRVTCGETEALHVAKRRAAGEGGSGEVEATCSTKTSLLAHITNRSRPHHASRCPTPSTRPNLPFNPISRPPIPLLTSIPVSFPQSPPPLR